MIETRSLGADVTGRSSVSVPTTNARSVRRIVCKVYDDGFETSESVVLEFTDVERSTCARHEQRARRAGDNRSDTRSFHSVVPPLRGEGRVLADRKRGTEL
jgi:hypothetical protein